MVSYRNVNESWVRSALLFPVFSHELVEARFSLSASNAKSLSRRAKIGSVAFLIRDSTDSWVASPEFCGSNRLLHTIRCLVTSQDYQWFVSYSHCSFTYWKEGFSILLQLVSSEGKRVINNLRLSCLQKIVIMQVTL